MKECLKSSDLTQLLILYLRKLGSIEIHELAEGHIMK